MDNLREALAEHFNCQSENITHFVVSCEYIKDEDLHIGWAWSDSAIWQIEGIVRRVLVAVMKAMGANGNGEI